MICLGRHPQSAQIRFRRGSALALALCLLAMSSCQSPPPPPGLMQPGPMQPGLAQPGYPPDIPPGAIPPNCMLPCGPPGMESGVPLPYEPVGPWKPSGIAGPWPAGEYLRDGGDKSPPVQVKHDFQVTGLDMEDTVAHFDTLDGRTLVEPSNRVIIYSPRFAAVRQVVSLVENEQAKGLADLHLPTRLMLRDDIQGAKLTKQNLEAERELGIKHATAFRGEQGEAIASNAVKAVGFQNAFKAYEDLAVIRYGQMLESEAAVLAKSSQAAVTWTGKQSVQVILERQAAQALVSDERAEAVFTVNKPPSCPKLRIVKVASTQLAQPGDVVSFTLRFDNVGNEMIGNVTILDNLTPRLEYVPKSTQCSLAAELKLQPNEGGSKVLRWEIKDPLPPGKGGVIRFDCRVR
jgi:uncharacterized repeat protein (TIGR01451 family)